MNDVKNVFLSKTVWAAALAVLGSVGALFHINFGAADQGAVIDAIYQIVGAVGGLLAIWGRIAATKLIG